MHLRGPGLAQQSVRCGREVVPRTMESSTSTTRLPLTVAADGVQLDADGVLALGFWLG